eukprot:GHVU01158384.1.p1 GENE.GHVU01158384.1~~GHVU01158384.1.p1  ORF type:complete len:188 (+),score=36.49 GHVU01158384.1:2343-2906(+)
MKLEDLQGAKISALPLKWWGIEEYDHLAKKIKVEFRISVKAEEIRHFWNLHLKVCNVEVGLIGPEVIEELRRNTKFARRLFKDKVNGEELSLRTLCRLEVQARALLGVDREVDQEERGEEIDPETDLDERDEEIEVYFELRDALTARLLELGIDLPEDQQTPSAELMRLLMQVDNEKVEMDELLIAQ